MRIKIDGDKPQNGLLALVISVVEVITDALKLQAVKRMDSGRLSDEEIERLGLALMKLDRAIHEIKQEHELSRAVKAIKQALDDVVNTLAEEEKSLVVME